MALTTCSVCGTDFSARSDAVYCSSACRQKAHRARIARRTAALRESLKRSSGPARVASDANRSLRLAVAGSLQRAREQVDRSRELCRVSERRVREGEAIRQQFVIDQASSWTLPKRAPWPGN